MAINLSKRAKTIATVCAVAVAVSGFLTWRVGLWSYQAGRADRVEDKHKRIEERLLQSHSDDRLSSSMAESLLKDLSEVIDKESDGDENQRRQLRLAFARRLVTFFQGADVSLGQSGNLDFELVALRDWKEFSELLARDSNTNASIIYRYFIALSNLRELEPDFVAAAEIHADGKTTSVEPKNRNNGTMLRDLSLGYGKHVEVFRDSLKSNDSRINKENLLQSFCWYYSATRNPSLTRTVFHYGKSEFTEENGRCNGKTPNQGD